MFRSYLAAALRNLARSRFYAGISIAGLAIGLCAALLSFLVIRNQLTFDHFIPGYERIYLAVSGLATTGRAPDFRTGSNHHLGQQLQLRFKEVEATTRVKDEDTQLRHGSRRGMETVYWADPNFLDVIALPVFAGDLHAALRRPDGIVLPRSVAKKYFGREAVLGATLEVGTHPMTVTAVIEDLPPHATQLETGILAAGLAAWSPLTALDNEPPDSRKFMVNVRTYMRLASGASLEPVSRGLPEVMRTLWPAKPAGLNATVDMVRIDQVHVFKGLNPSIAVLFAITAAVGLIILFVACVNFVNLATARAARRSMEVAIRKAAGATRGALIVQFLGESLLYVTLATLIAVALTELTLPAVNVFMNSGAVFDYWRDPALLAWLAGVTLGLSVIAGIYPAFVLSAFRPAVALKGANAQGRGGNLTRQILVTLQFATLMMLMVAAAIMFQQRSFATHEALRVDTDQHLMLKTAGCNSAFKTELQRLPGVLGASCSGWAFLSNASFTLTRALNNTEVSIGVTPVDAGLLELYGLKPIAGRFLSDARDTERYVPDPLSEAGARGVINESGLRTLGFSAPQAAIGKVIKLYGSTEIVGVVADFSVGSVERAIAPTIYVGAPRMSIYIDVRLRGQQIPETLQAIDRLWAHTPGGSEPLQRFFLNDYIQDLYLTVLRVAQWFGAMAIVAVLLSCLGLIGLSASTTERRTKEIGIRKAMGATRLEILRLMVWQFIKPVLWACVIAAPISAWLMNRWLEGYAYHTDLTPWPFIGAATLVLAIAILTVSVHCYAIARAKPVAALRYE